MQKPKREITSVEQSASNGLLNAEKLAKRFHEKYELLAPYYKYETRLGSRTFWENVPENNKKLMIAVCSELLNEGI